MSKWARGLNHRAVFRWRWLEPQIMFAVAAIEEVAMKIAVAAAAFAALVTTVSFDYAGFWVVKDSRQSGCSIVTSNPVIDGPIGPILWGSGPYRSEKDAELAKSTIGSCN